MGTFVPSAECGRNGRLLQTHCTESRLAKHTVVSRVKLSALSVLGRSTASAFRTTEALLSTKSPWRAGVAVIHLIFKSPKIHKPDRLTCFRLHFDTWKRKLGCAQLLHCQRSQSVCSNSTQAALRYKKKDPEQHELLPG